jgi:hypothetical protein
MPDNADVRPYVNFGVEALDDLLDGMVWLIWGIVEQGLALPKIHWIEA